jgi:lipoyl(octanoyl) transferase
MPPARSIAVYDLGLTAYADVLALQRRLQAARRVAGSDVLLLTEHQPVITLGRGHPEPSLRASPEEVARAGIAIVPTERGGDITFHGPGQLVAYGIIDLKGWDLALLDYLAGLEDTVVDVLAGWHVAGQRRPGARGVWVDRRKIASVGLNVRRWVTMHGIALNVASNLELFELINPCGVEDLEMTSLSREAGVEVSVSEAADLFATSFAGVFACSLTKGDPGRLLEVFPPPP